MTFGPPTYTDLHFGHLFSLPPEAGLQPQHGTLTSGTFGFTGAFALGHTPHRTCHSVSFVLGTASSGPIEIQWRVSSCTFWHSTARSSETLPCTRTKCGWGKALCFTGLAEESLASGLSFRPSSKCLGTAVCGVILVRLHYGVSAPLPLVGCWGWGSQLGLSA